ENSINQFYPKCNQLSYEPHFIFTDKMSQARNVWKDINLLQQHSMDNNLEESILKTINLFKDTRNINIFGLRTSRSVAIYLENSINQFYPKCNQLSYEPHFIF